MATTEMVEDALLQGFQEGTGAALSLFPVAGPFLQLMFSHIWDLALAERTIAQKQAAMDSLFKTVGSMINQALANHVADEARAYNATIAQLGRDYRVSVQSFQQSASSTAVRQVVVRFEGCKSTLVHMLNLFAQPSYMKHTVLSYGSALALYVGLLREMMLAGISCGYNKADIVEFHNQVNECLNSAYEKVMFEAVSKLVKESGEFAYPNMGSIVMNLEKLVGGLMNLNTEWHDGKACLIAQNHPDYPNCDLVDNKAYYQLQLHTKTGPKNYYSMPQVFLNNRAALHVYTDVDKDLHLASFAVKNTMHVKVRAYYLIDYDDYDSSNVEVTVSTRRTPKVHQFHLNKRERTILSFPWVRLYYSLSSDGGAWSTDYDRFSANLRMHYDEYSGFQCEQDTIYSITTKAGSSATKNYYIIGFEIVPILGVPDVLESLTNAIKT